MKRGIRVMGPVRTGCAVLALAVALALAAPAPAAPVSAAARAAAPSRVDSEASFEYLLGLAGSLAKGDTAAQLRVLKSRLDALLLEKKALQARLADVVNQLHAAQGAGDQAKAQALQAAVANLSASLGKVDVEIDTILDEIRKIQQREDVRADEARRVADALRKFEAALLENPPRDAFVKTLSPAARQSALPKARHGYDAIGSLIRVAVAAAAEANAAALAGAEKQRQLLEEQKRLRELQAKLQTAMQPAPLSTPTRSVVRTVSPPK